MTYYRYRDPETGRYTSDRRRGVIEVWQSDERGRRHERVETLQRVPVSEGVRFRDPVTGRFIRPELAGLIPSRIETYETRTGRLVRRTGELSFVPEIQRPEVVAPVRGRYRDPDTGRFISEREARRRGLVPEVRIPEVTGFPPEEPVETAFPEEIWEEELSDEDELDLARYYEDLGPWDDDLIDFEVDWEDYEA